MPNADKSPFITSGTRFRNYLGVAFVISLVVHALFAPFLKNMTQASESQQVEKVSVTKKITVKPPTPPPPTPTPPPPKMTPPPKQQIQQPQPKLVVHPPKTTSNNNTSASENKYIPPKSGSENGVPAGNGTASPAPVVTVGPPASTPTPKPACATPYQEATAVNTAPVDYPDQAREANVGVVQVNVIVSLSATGAPTSATLQNSSGNMFIDSEAKRAAMQSTYAPKIVACQPISSQYIFKVTFDPNG